ncbi:MAG: caspase family protein, partial [Deferribacteraceae bacterium]|nr:caspase family protein [Deferribacteraceae bacterium]
GAMKLKVNIEEAFSVTALDISHDGAHIAASFSDGTIRIFSSSGGILERGVIHMSKAVADIAFIEDDSALLVASDKLYYVDINAENTANTLAEIEGFPSFRPTAVSVAHGFGLASQGSRLCAFNLTSKRYAACRETPSEIQSLAADGITLSAFTASKDGRVRRYSLSGFTLKKEAFPALGRITSIAIAQGKAAFSGDYGTAVMDKTLEGEAVRLSRLTDTVRSVDITADGRFVLAGGDDMQAAVWDMNTNHTESVSAEPALPINHVAADPFFRYMVIAYYTPGDIGGFIQIRFTTDKRQIRNIYAFRDATLTADAVGYVDGDGPFGNYISYLSGERVIPFASVANTVHKPERMGYKLTIPRVATSPRIHSTKSFSDAIDTEGPVIALDERGIAPVKPTDKISAISGQITDNSTISWARYDSHPLELGSGGEFRFELVVPKEGREVIISASDILGNTSSRSVILTRDEESEDNAAIAAEGTKKIALLIAVNRYSSLAALRTPEFDARRVAELLRSKYGYEPILLLGKAATRDAVMGEINRLRRTLTNKDQLIIYFAGHGFLDGARAYWQVYDSVAGDDTRDIYTAQLTANLAAMKAKQVLVISDSCFSGAISEASKTNSALKGFIASGSLEPVADIGKGKHSVFTEVLIKVLNAPPKEGFTGTSLYELIKKGMPKSAKQTPVYKPLSDSDFELKQL